MSQTQEGRKGLPKREPQGRAAWWRVKNQAGRKQAEQKLVQAQRALWAARKQGFISKMGKPEGEQDIRLVPQRGLL